VHAATRPPVRPDASYEAPESRQACAESEVTAHYFDKRKRLSLRVSGPRGALHFIWFLLSRLRYTRLLDLAPVLPPSQCWLKHCYRVGISLAHCPLLDAAASLIKYGACSSTASLYQGLAFWRGGEVS
jgi:hypothetical protein